MSKSRLGESLQEKPHYNQNLLKQSIIMYCTCTEFLNRRHNPRTLSSSNSSGTQQLKHSLINTFPSSSTCHKNWKTNLTIPHQIKPPSSSQEDIKLFRSFFCAERLRSSFYKYCCCSLSLKNCKLRQSRHPYGKHVASNSSISSRRIKDTSSPKIRSPTNCSIALKITSKDTKSCKDTQRSNHRKRYPRNSLSIFLCIIWCIKNQKQNTKTVCTSQQSNSHQNLVTISRKTSGTCQSYFLNCIFTIVSCLKRPSLKAQRSLLQHSPSQRQRRMGTTRSTHILHIKTPMNNYSPSLKLQCFKTCVSYLMVHCQPIMAHRQCNHHITLLTTCTISNYTFYIILYSTHSSSHQSSYCSNNGQNSSTRYTLFPKGICTSNLKNSSSNQCCCVNLCRYGSRQINISLPNEIWDYTFQNHFIWFIGFAFSL